MLDEQVEFDEYIKLLNNKDESRLIASLFFKEEKGKKSVKCSGVTRALTILARHYLFHNGQNYYELKEKQRDVLRKEVRNRLEEWCFLEDDKKSGLYNYFNINEKNDLWNNFKESKEKVWTSTNIYAPINAKESYEFAINFSIIIAEAIYAGPLKVRYLKIKKGFEEKINYQTKTTRKKARKNKENIKLAVEPLVKKVGNEVKITGKREDYREQFLKQICAYLVKREVPSQFVSVNYIDLANWMGMKSFATNSDEEQIYFFCGTQEVFTYRDKYLRVGPKIIKELEIELIDEEQYEQLKEQKGSNYIIYKDTGAGVRTMVTL